MVPSEIASNSTSLLLSYKSIEEFFDALYAQFVLVGAWQVSRDELASLTRRTLVAAYT